MNQQIRSIVWLRADLRIYDNPALHAAARDGACLVFYALCRDQWEAHNVSLAKQDLIIRQLACLATELERMNIPLWVEDCGDFSNVPGRLKHVCEQLGVTKVFCNLEYELNERRLTQAVRANCAQNQIELKTFHDQCAIAPGQILNKQGQMYRVFTSFRKSYEANIDALARPILPAPPKQAMTGVASKREGLQSIDEGNELKELWPAGEDEAHDRLGRFIDQKLSLYKARRDQPSLAATSEISPYLAIGALSTTQCFHALRSLSRGALHSRNEGYTTWMHELIWREFYRHLVVAFPEVCRYRAFIASTDRLPWKQDAELFEAWCQGRTGFPIVDAGMRQLNTTGWMHNRVRMICAMFLSKHLFLDWRLGERYFMQNLIDADFASNNGGWQWSASTGVDAAPYFRIFNPQRQSERFDRDGDYIQTYVSELRHVSAPNIHNPSKDIRRKYHYPSAVIDHAEAVATTKQHFASLSSSAARQEQSGVELDAKASSPQNELLLGVTDS